MSDKKDKKKDAAPPVDGDAEGTAAEGGEELDLEGKKKGLKPIIMIVGTVVLLAGAGAGAYFSGVLDSVLGKTPDAAEHAEGEHGEAKADAKGHGEKKAKKKEKGGHGKEGAGGTEGFLPLPDLVVNLSTTQGQPRYLKLKVQLELDDPADQGAVEAIAPRVIDHFQTYLRELRVSDLRGSAGIYRLRQELLSRVNDAAAPVVIKDVLFQEILIQ